MLTFSSTVFWTVLFFLVYLRLGHTVHTVLKLNFFFLIYDGHILVNKYSFLTTVELYHLFINVS